MNKKLFIIPLLAGAAMLLPACSDEDNLFDQTAAERLEAGQSEYFSALTAQGGKWVMEYFSNAEEPGYLFVMQFNPDKSVTIATDHKWIGGTYKEELSLWDVINDNGNVLSFNSFNTLFHIFSTPENFEGEDAPKDDNGEDVDEQGYGHNGDYEFLLMENTDNTIRLLGKKRGFYAYLHRLPADTDNAAYLANVNKLRNQFDAKTFPTYTLVETATGAKYDVTGLSKGVISVVPNKSTSPFARTMEQASIFTADGLRPLHTFEIIREDDSRFNIDSFTWAADGALEAPGVRLTAPWPSESLLREDLTWSLVDGKNCADIEAAIAAANVELNKISKLGKNNALNALGLGFSQNALTGNLEFGIIGNIGKRPFGYYGTIAADGANKVKINPTNPSEILTVYVLKDAPAMQALIDLFAGEFTVENVSGLNPSEINFTSVANPNLKFTVKVNK